MPMSTDVRSTRVRSAWSALAVALLGPLALACGSDSLKPQPVPEPSEVFWDLMLSEHAVTLALTPPYDTLTVVATPRNYQGEALAGLPRPEYRSLQPDFVGVTPDGVLTAVAAHSLSISGVPVIASLTVNNLRHTDTVIVRVVDDPAPQDHLLETFSIHPVPPDSAKLAANPAETIGARTLDIDNMLSPLVRATYVGGVPVPTTPMAIPNDFFGGTVDVANLHVSIRSSDTTKAVVQPLAIDAPIGIVLFGIKPGNIQLYASTTVFGVTKVDTLPFRIGFPLRQDVHIEPVTAGSPELLFVQRSIVLGTGGLVRWLNNSANYTTDVTFANPTNVAAFNTTTAGLWASQMAFWCETGPFIEAGFDCAATGNLTIGRGTTFNFRVFPVPGVYEYHNAHGQTGRITVSGD